MKPQGPKCKYSYFKIEIDKFVVSMNLQAPSCKPYIKAPISPMAQEITNGLLLSSGGHGGHVCERRGAGVSNRVLEKHIKTLNP